jgi:hypothetical protein
MFRFVFFFILLLPPLPLGVHMTIIAYNPSTSVSPFSLLTSDGPVPCANLATARAIRDGRGADPITVTPRNIEQAFGCTVGGAGYDAAVTWCFTGRVERCHNWATAKVLARNNPAGVTPSVTVTRNDGGVNVLA